MDLESSGRDSAVALLALEIGTVWATDERGRLRGSAPSDPQLVIAVGSDGRTVAIGAGLPDALADDLRRAGEAPVGHESAASGAAGERPPELDACVRLLGTLGAVTVTSGPSFVASSGPSSPPNAPLRRSSGADDDLEPLRPVPQWEPDEWRDLLTGRLGPWAMSVEAGQVTALCHSSRLNERAAEAGVWTHPDFRGQGRASAVTAAWVGHPDLGDRVRFYSTSSDNVASRGVAAKMCLRPIGWMWKLAVQRVAASTSFSENG